VGHDGVVTVTDAKALLRAEIRAAREARSDADRAVAARAIADNALRLLPDQRSSISAYLSLPTEPGVDALITDAQAAGHDVRVPRITGRDLQWVDLTRDSVFATGPLGIREPLGPALDSSTLASLDVMLVPGLAVDRRGRRLGQGGGFFDRVLASVPSHADGGPLVAIVLFDDEVRDWVPVEPHDCRVDVAVTPGGIVWFTA